MKYLLSYSTLILLLCSCQESFDPQIEVTEQLVVYADVAPKRDIELSLTRTLGFTESPTTVAEAEVLISSGSITNELIFTDGEHDDKNISSYLLRSLDVPSKSRIELTINHPEFKQLKGTTFIPDEVCPSTIDISLLSRTEVLNRCVLNFRMSMDIDSRLWNGVNNDFHVIPFYHIADRAITGTDTVFTTEAVRRSLQREDYSEDQSLFFDFAKGVLIDHETLLENQGVIQIDFDVEFNCESEILENIQFELRNLSEEYSNYHAQLAKITSMEFSENIYMEPVVDFSNITNGLGHFGAYNYCTSVVEPPE